MRQVQSIESHLLPAHMNAKVTPKIQIEINSKSLYALLDTGASHSFLHVNTVKSLNLSMQTNNLPKIFLGDSSFIIPLGLCSVEFKFSNILFKQDFFVLENLPFSCVLGTDFIKHSDLVIDLSKACCYFSFLPTAKIYFENMELLCALQGLQPTQNSMLQNLLGEFSDVLTDRIGCTNIVKCNLVVNSKPIAQKPYPVSPFKKALIRDKVKQLLELGFIRSSKSEWASPVNIRKQGEDYRFCLDYRKLNNATKSDPYPIPRMDTLLSKLGNASFISKLDLRKGYWQVEMEESSIPYTAFICDEGKYEFLRMPFGLKTAPSIFQRFANQLLGEARGVFADAYLDDIIIYSCSWDDHLQHIRYVLERLREAKITLNVGKCEFGKTSIKYLGFVITTNGVEVDRDKTSPIDEYPVPKTAREVKRFLGLAGWYRHFIKDFSNIVAPLNKLLSRSAKFKWEEVHSRAFQNLKAAISSTTALAFPDFNKSFTLRTDSSDVGLGAVLSQTGLDNNEQPIAFASRLLTKTEQSYHATEKECLAIVWALKKFEPYLDGQQFLLETDNRALTWLHSMKDASSKFMRWAMKIQDFQPTIRHRPGKLNVVADALSRAPVGDAEEEEIKEVMDPPTNVLLTMASSLSTCITLEQLKQEQSVDAETQALISNLPNSFIVENNLLYRVNKFGSKLPFIPISLRASILSYFHDSPHSGHFGFRKTLKRLTSRVFWFQLHSDTLSHIKTCKVCQACKNPSSKPHGELTSITTNGPWDVLAIDCMGPLPTTRNRNAHLFVVVDHFTKWVEMFAIKNIQASTICAVLQNEIFCRWGTPRSILSDNATYFRSKTFQNMCSVWGVRHKFTTPYHPQSNITERVNRNIRAMLSSYVATKHNKWDMHLNALSFALRTAIHDSTGFSPAMMNLGRSLHLPFDRAMTDDVQDFSSRFEFRNELVDKLALVYSKARICIEKGQATQKKHYDSRHRRVIFQEGDMVLVRTHFLSDKGKKFMKKLAYRWDGPYRVSKCCTPLTYELSSLDGKVFGVHNIQHLKRYFDRPSYSDSFKADDTSQPITQP